MSGCACEVDATHRQERKILRWLLAINAVMFAFELVAGWLAESAGLIADSLDMLADAGVYGIALYAVGRSLTMKSRAALFAGTTEVLLALVMLLEVLRRFMFGSEPQSLMMSSVATLALAANLACLAMLSKYREGEVHMRASWIFSVNDVLANIGVIVAGVLVYASGSRYPDLAIGFIISIMVFRGGATIFREARKSLTTDK